MNSRQIIVLLAVFFLPTALVQGDNFQNEALPERDAIVTISRHIEHGEYAQAENIAAKALQHYPKSDDLHSLLGETLYKTGRIEQAADAFRTSLNLNHLNEIAKEYLAEIESTETLRVASEIREWIAIARSQAGDFIALVIGIWLGTTLNPIGHFLYRMHFTRRSRNKLLRAMRENNYQSYADFLEKLLAAQEYPVLRKSLCHMLTSEHIGYVKAMQIIQENINDEYNVGVLERMLKRELSRTNPAPL